MRFVLNFIFFGLLFFIIWKFFPEAFHTLVTWVTALYDWLYHLFHSLFEQVNKAEATKEAPKAALLLPWLFWKK